MVARFQIAVRLGGVGQRVVRADADPHASVGHRGHEPVGAEGELGGIGDEVRQRRPGYRERSRRVEALQVERRDRPARRTEQYDGPAHGGGGEACLGRIGADTVVDDRHTFPVGQVPHPGRQVRLVAHHLGGAGPAGEYFLLVGGDRGDDGYPGRHRQLCQDQPNAAGPGVYQDRVATLRMRGAVQQIVGGEPL